jgi:dCTP diphosphatase
VKDAAILELVLALRRFAEERDWDQFHSPKNLSAALAVEAGELLEHFQWLTDEQSRNLSPSDKERVALEIADVFLYLLRLTDRLDVDLLSVARKKLELNAKKYPVERARGTARKYTDL